MPRIRRPSIARCTRFRPSSPTPNNRIIFIVLHPTKLRQMYPGWEFIEAKMWNSTFLRQFLLVIVGRKGYDERYAEWVENSKYGGLNK